MSEQQTINTAGADRLRTAESRGKGQLMDGSPSHVTNDKALVKNLGLDFEVVFAGSEAAQVPQIRQFAKEHNPFLTYWYEPQWLFERVPMTEVKLPEHPEGCDTDPEKVACAGRPEVGGAQRGGVEAVDAVMRPPL